MANTITDNRTLLDNANATTNFVGSTSPSQDQEIFIFDGGGTGASVGEQISDTVRWVMFDAGTAQDWSNNHFYIWINCGIVGLLDLKANGGFTIRFAGPNTNNFFEFYVGGSDSWPTAVSGGWVQFVVDIEAAQDNTGGTPPLTNAIQHVGYSAVTATVMTRNTDNTWIDALWRLPAATPGIIVEGRNGGSTDWDFADIFTELTIQSGAFREGPGGSFVINTPLQIGVNTTAVVTGFTDTNVALFWDDAEFVAIDHYNITGVGHATGTTNITFGVKSGTGAAATGAQGITVQAAAVGVRWDLDLNDVNLDIVDIFGCNFIHGDTFDLDLAIVDLATVLFLDCTRANVANAAIVRASVVDANTATGVAFMVTDDLGDIANSVFQFSAGHAIELNAATPTAQNNVGNLFAGYTNTVDSLSAAILNSAAGALTLSSSGGSDLQTDSYRNTGGGSVTIENNISVTFTGMKDDTQVRVELNSTGAFVAGIEDVTAGSVDNRTFTWSAAAGTLVNYILHNFDNAGIDYESIRVIAFTVPVADTSIPIQQRIDRNSV